jgi:hypothetical protein
LQYLLITTPEMSVTLRYPTKSKYQTFYSPSPVCLLAESVRKPSRSSITSTELQRLDASSDDRSLILEGARKRATSKKTLDPKDKDEILNRVRREFQQKKNLEDSKNTSILMRIRLEEQRLNNLKQEQLHHLQRLRMLKQLDESHTLTAIRTSAKANVQFNVPKDIQTLYSRYSDTAFKLESTTPVDRIFRPSAKPRIGEEKNIQEKSSAPEGRGSATFSEPLQDLQMTESLTFSDTKASRDLLERVSQLLAQHSSSLQPGAAQDLANSMPVHQSSELRQGDETPQKLKSPR